MSKKRKAIEPISFTGPRELKDEIIQLADDHGTNRSWMGRLLLRNSLDKMTFNQIARAVMKDPDSKRRVIK